MELNGQCRCFHLLGYVIEEKVCNVSRIISPINCYPLVPSERVSEESSYSYHRDSPCLAEQNPHVGLTPMTISHL
jgi:hypothetical protein